MGVDREEMGSRGVDATKDESCADMTLIPGCVCEESDAKWADKPLTGIDIALAWSWRLQPLVFSR